MLREADKVGCFILVGYVQPHFFGGALALVEHSRVLTEVHVQRVRPQGKEGGPDINIVLVEDVLVLLELLNHRARCLVDLPDVVLIIIGNVLVVGVCYYRGNAVEVYRLTEVVLVLGYPVLRGDDLLVCGGGVVHDVGV